MTNTLSELADTVEQLDPELDRSDDTFKIAIVLLASAQLGADIDKLEQFTHFDRSLLDTVDTNLRKSEVWVGDRVQANWFDDENGGIDFWLDCAVAQGLVERASSNEAAEEK